VVGVDVRDVRRRVVTSVVDRQGHLLCLISSMIKYLNQKVSWD